MCLVSYSVIFLTYVILSNNATFNIVSPELQINVSHIVSCQSIRLLQFALLIVLLLHLYGWC